LLERFLELVERVHMLDCSGERSISDEVSQLLVNLFDLCAGLPLGMISSHDSSNPESGPSPDPTNDKVVVNACELTPYNIQENVTLYDAFWIKAQPYSLSDIFMRLYQPLAQLFTGGSVHQAFLSAYDYHRWHAPVSGVITHAYVIDGTYYSDVESEGVDPAGPNDSQGHITAVATRAIIVIQCADPTMGSVACVFEGMAE